jgi:hypothetical protein
VAVSQRARSPGNYRTHTVTNGLKRLKLPEALRSRSEPNEFVRDGSPWEKYEKSHDLRLGEGDEDRVTMANVRYPWSNEVHFAGLRGPTAYLVNVRSFPTHDGEEKCRMLQWIRHNNIVSFREIFSYERSFHAVFEHMPMFLSLFVGFQRYFSEPQLASILG